MRSRFILASILAFLVVGCATSGGSSGEPRVNRDLLTEEDLADMENYTAFEAVRRLRPMWMRPGGVRNSANPAGYYPHVFVDGAPYGPMDSLSGFRAADIQQMRYVDPTDATIRYGGRYQGGVILVDIKG